MTLDENHLRDLLDDAELPLTKVELATVVEQGRRKRRRHRVAEIAGGIGLAVVLTAAVATPIALRNHHTPAGRTVAGKTGAPSIPATAPQAAPKVTTCPVKALKLPAGRKNYVTSIVDPSGRYIGGFASSDTIYSSILWSNGVPKVLSLPGIRGEIDAVNAAGTVAGDSTVGGSEHVFRYAKGAYTILDVPMAGSWHIYGVYINLSGVIVANAEPAHNTGGTGAVALRWNAGSTMAVKLPLTNAEVFGIADNGWIVGTSYKHGSATQAWVWDGNGRNGRKLATPAGDGSVAYEVRGTVAGGGTFPKGTSDEWNGGVEWNIVTGKATTLSNASGPLASVNSAGSTVDGNGGVYLNDAKARLKPLHASDEIGAGAISDFGLVIGTSTATKTNISTPVEWHC